MTTAIYLRISNDREGRELGVQRQEQDCRALAERLGLTVSEVFSDNDISATRRSTKVRPDYQRMLSEVAAGRITTVIASTSSRLTRQPRELEDWIDAADPDKGGALRVAFVADPHVDLTSSRGRRRARDDANRDAEYADELSSLVRRKKQQQREAGIFSGGHRPFGFDPDGMTARVDEQDMIRAAGAAVLADRSLGGIARAWTELCPPPEWRVPFVVRWSPTTIRQILENPRLIGQLPSGLPAVWEPVLDEATYRGVLAVLADPARRRHRGGVKLLTGIGQCSRCGAALNASGANTYRCSAAHHMSRQCQPVDDYVRDTLLEYIAANQLTAPPPRTGPTTGELAGQAQGLRARLDAFRLSAAEPDGISPAALAVIERQIGAQLAEVEAQMVTAAGTSALAGLPLGLVELRAAWEAADGERRRAIVRACNVKILVAPPGRGSRVFDPDTVVITGTETA